jgi:predicted metalloprotease with PDZ domain
MSTTYTTLLGLLVAGFLSAVLPAAAEPGDQPIADAPVVAQAPILIEYLVSLPQPQTQMVDMAITIRCIKDEVLELALPVWRPGRYEVLDPAGTVREVRARSGRGHPLPIEKFEKSGWLVQTDAAEGDEVVTVEYRVYANALANRTRHVDDTHAFLSPSTVFMYAPALRDMPLRVHVRAPEGWRTATGLEPDPGRAGAWIAADYDTLVDSPLEIGLHDVMTFEVAGIPHEIAVWSPAGRPQYDREQMPRDFAKIIETQRQIFGELPYSRYVFLIHCYPGGRGGTEHLNSTIMQTSPQTFRSADAYRRFLKLVSHEMFHTWNVKQFRPAGLAPYDYQRENYTHLLWVAEGTTSYYDWLTLVRAGIVRPDDYLRTLSSAIDSLLNRPGALVQSLEESSFDAWIKFNRATPDSVNSTISFYDKGAQASLLLDMEIRARTQNERSLDDVMAHMYREFPLGGPGYTREDFIRAAERLTGTSFRRFFDDYISGTAALDFGILRTAGVEAVRPSPDRVRPYLGFSVEAREGLAAVTSVLADGPAYEAGLMVDDLVLSMNGERLRPSDLDQHTRRLTPGEKVHLTVIRHEVEREITLTTLGKPEARWTLRRVSDPTESQRQVYESWLGQPWPAGPATRPAGRPEREETTPTEDPHAISP